MRYDVAVVGAGPGGAWAASRLARRGARVVLLDPSHPREKPCGGGVTGRALAKVGSAIAEPPLSRVTVRGATFLDSARGLSVQVPLDVASQALIVASRTEFDGRLVDAAIHAGVTMVASRTVAIERTAGGFWLRAADGQEIGASFVVGADGANSFVRRCLSAPFTRAQLSMATGFYARGVTSDHIVVEMTDDPPGYIWSFPRPDHLSVGICAQANCGTPVDVLRARLRQWIVRTGVGANARLDPYSWPIPSLAAGDFSTLEIAGPGWLTLGDAAGLVDPITREGIFFALESGDFAVQALAGSGGDRARRYSGQVREEIGADLARAARYKAGFFRPAFSRLLIDALGASRAVREVMADLVAGTQPYRGLQWRLASTCQLGLAWRWLMERGYQRAR